MDINEIAKQMTRAKFLDGIDIEGWLILPKEFNINPIDCPSKLGLKNFVDCNYFISSYDCRKCWKEAIKNIKFKNDLEKENKFKNKEYTIQEVFNFPKGTEFKCVNTKYIVRIEETTELKNKYLIMPKYNLECKLNDIWLKEKFILFTKEYVTFNEAKKVGTPKHKNPDIGYDYGKLSANDFIKEMNKKVWEVKE